MRYLIFLVALVILTLETKAQTSLGIYRDTRAFYTAGVSTGGNLTKGILFSGNGTWYGTSENNDFSSVFSTWSLSHHLPSEWIGLDGLSAYGQYDNSINYAEPTTWRFGLGLNVPISVRDKRGSLLLKFAPVNTTEKGQQFGIVFLLPVFAQFSVSGFGNLVLVDGHSIWHVEPAIGAELESGMSAVAKYVRNEYLDNSDSWRFGVVFKL